MLTVTFEEPAVNAVTDALNRLVQAESAKLERLAAVRRMISERGDDDSDAMRDNIFADEACRAAISHAMRAQLDIAAAIDEPPLALTFASSWSVVERYQGEGR